MYAQASKFAAQGVVDARKAGYQACVGHLPRLGPSSANTFGAAACGASSSADDLPTTSSAPVWAPANPENRHCTSKACTKALQLVVVSSLEVSFCVWQVSLLPDESFGMLGCKIRMAVMPCAWIQRGACQSSNLCDALWAGLYCKQ